MLKQKHTPGPWEIDHEQNDGTYGDGPDARSGFRSYSVHDSNGRVLFDCINSDVAEIHEEYDEYGVVAWDAVGEANLTLASAAPDLFDALQWAELHFRKDGEGSPDQFDRIAEAFYRDTGVIRPGKDDCVHPCTMKEREEAFNKWMAEGKQKIRDALVRATR